MPDDVALRAEDSATDVTGAAGPLSRPRQALAWLVATVWVWPAVLALALGLWRISGPELWQDELVTVDVAGRSVSHILSLLGSVDAVHGMYYLFMHGWVGVFGDSVLALRLPSTLAIAGAAACVALIGQRLFDHTSGLLGGLVFALVPGISRFGQEVRSYGFVVLVAALSTLLFLRAIDPPESTEPPRYRRSVLRWAAYALTITVAIFLNAVAAALVVGHAAGLVIWLWRRWDWRPVFAFVSAVILGCLAAWPVLIFGMQQANRQVIWIPHDPPFATLVKTVMSAEIGWALILASMLVAFRLSRNTLFAAAVAALPLPMIYIASLGQINYFFNKYLLFAVPACAVLAGAGLATLRWRWAMAAGVVAFALLGLPDQIAVRDDLSHSWYTYPRPRPPAEAMAYSDAARIVAEQYQPGDGIVYQRGGGWWRMVDQGVSYYLPSDVTPRDLFLDKTAEENDELKALECASAAPCLGNEKRVWVVVAGTTDNVLSGLDEDQGAALHDRYAQTWLDHPAGLTVGLLERRVA